MLVITYLSTTPLINGARLRLSLMIKPVQLVGLVLNMPFSEALCSNELTKTTLEVQFRYRIYSINCPGRLLNFWTLAMGAYSRWALIRGWALIKFSPFSAKEVCLFCNKIINATNKTRRSNKARFL